MPVDWLAPPTDFIEPPAPLAGELTPPAPPAPPKLAGVVVVAVVEPATIVVPSHAAIATHAIHSSPRPASALMSARLPRTSAPRGGRALSRGAAASDSMRPVRRLLVAVLVAATTPVVALHAGCGGAEPGTGATTIGAGGGAWSSWDAGAVDARSDGAAPPVDAADAGPSPVLVAITPNPANEGASAPGPTASLEAELDTFAAGVRATVLSRAPRELDQAGLASLSAARSFLVEHGQAVVVNLAYVDRAADGRPDDMRAKPWNDPAALDALDALVDTVVDRIGDDLSGLTFGRDVDVYLSQHPSERAGFRGFAVEACAHAKARLAGRARLGVGVGFSFAGATTPDPIHGPVLAACSAAVLSYMPGLGGTDAVPASAVAGAVDAMIAAAGGKPILLQGVGYPSADAVGSSPEKQALFFQTFFQALGPRRAAFELVEVFQLHDLGKPLCAALAERQGESTSGPFASYLCSTGLHAAGDQAKPAWLEVLSGASSFLSP